MSVATDISLRHKVHRLVGKANMASTTSALTTVLPNVDLEGSSSHMPNIVYNNVSEMYVEFSEQNENSQQVWNLSKATVASLPEKLPSPFNVSSTTVYTTTMSNSFDEFGPPEGVEYIFVPLGVVVFVIILSAVVLIVSRKRKLEKLRHRLMPMYNFDPGEEEDDDWETELLDELDHQRRQGYQTMDIEENAELFSTH